MGWFSKSSKVESEEPRKAESDWKDYTSHPDLTCKANPSQLAIVAPLGERLTIAAAALGTLHRRLSELIPEAAAVYSDAPNPGDDPNVSEVFETALKISGLNNDLVTIETFEELGGLIKGIQNSLEDGDASWAETFAGFLALGTQEVLSSLTAVQWALNEPSRNVWGFRGEVFDGQQDSVLDQVHDNEDMHPIDRISVTLNIVETNLMALLWMTEAIFAQKLLIEYHLYQKNEN